MILLFSQNLPKKVLRPVEAYGGIDNTCIFLLISTVIALMKYMIDLVLHLNHQALKGLLLKGY